MQDQGMVATVRPCLKQRIADDCDRKTMDDEKATCGGVGLGGLHAKRVASRPSVHDHLLT